MAWFAPYLYFYVFFEFFTLSFYFKQQKRIQKIKALSFGGGVVLIHLFFIPPPKKNLSLERVTVILYLWAENSRPYIRSF